jgi:hypothetical protein
MQYENYNCVIRYLSYILQNLAHIFRLRCVLLAHRFTIKFSVNAKGVFQIESNVIEILHVVFCFNIHFVIYHQIFYKVNVTIFYC